MKIKWISLKIAVLSFFAWGQITLQSKAQTVIDGASETNEAVYIVGISSSESTLLITNGGNLFVTNSVNVEGFLISSLIGSNSSSHLNSATVTGVGSMWTNEGNIAIGWRGTNNTLMISDGAEVFNSGGYMGFFATSSNNVVQVTGANSLWSNRSSLYVGWEGRDNTLTISNGAEVLNSGGFIGVYSSSSNNVVQVTGANSLWSNRGDLYVGLESRDNTLTISNGAEVFNSVGVIGTYSSSSNNVVLVTGANSLWSNRSDLYVGWEDRDNTLTISDGAEVFNTIGVIGYLTASSNNVVLVTGANSLWSNQSDLYVGLESRDNTLTISNGAQVFNSQGNIGNLSVSNQVTVTGVGSVWSNHDELWVGRGGQYNSLIISNGAAVFNSQGIIGENLSSSNNMVTVTGDGAMWSNRGNLQVGNNGIKSMLNIENRGAVYATNMLVGVNVFSANNLVTISGAGSQLIVTNAAGTGTYDIRRGTNVQNGGTVMADRLLVTNVAVGGTGGVYILNGGTTHVGRVTISNEAIFQIGNGTDTAYFRQTQASVTNTFANGIQINAGGTLSFAGTITNVVTFNGGTLSGSGTLTTALTIDNGAVISPGNSPGTFNGSDMTWGNGGAYNFEIFDAMGVTGTDWDLINLTGTLTAGNPFTINVISMNSMTTFGNMINFDATQDYQWEIASALDIQNFNSEDFSLNLSSLSNYSFGLWSLTTDGNSIFLNYQAIPEPSTWAMLILGAICAGIALRKRPQKLPAD